MRFAILVFINRKIETYLKGNHMLVHLFISEHAVSRNRLKDALRDHMVKFKVIQYHSPEDIGRVVPHPSNEPNVAVVMLGKKDELILLAHNMYFHRLKKILILPEKDQKSTTKALTLSPIYISHMDSDFSEVVQILDNIYGRFDVKDANQEFQEA